MGFCGSFGESRFYLKISFKIIKRLLIIAFKLDFYEL